jgi:hypothetical protein
LELRILEDYDEFLKTTYDDLHERISALRENCPEELIKILMDILA